MDPPLHVTCLLFVSNAVSFHCRNMPEIDVLMQEWPAEVEEMLNEVSTFCILYVSYNAHSCSFWIYIFMGTNGIFTNRITVIKL